MAEKPLKLPPGERIARKESAAAYARQDEKAIGLLRSDWPNTSDAKLRRALTKNRAMLKTKTDMARALGVGYSQFRAVVNRSAEVREAIARYKSAHEAGFTRSKVVLRRYPGGGSLDRQLSTVECFRLLRGAYIAATHEAKRLGAYRRRRGGNAKFSGGLTRAKSAARRYEQNALEAACKEDEWKLKKWFGFKSPRVKIIARG